MKMKRVALAFCAVLAFSAAALAADVALTSIGQGPDAMMVKVVLRSLKVTPDFEALMKPEALTDQKVLIAVVGGSSKGLGAAGIDKEQEVVRTKALCDAAVAKGMKILIMHVGGEGRRGTLSDLFVNAAAPYGDAMIIVDGGNTDGIFTKYAEAKNIEILTAANVKGCKEPLAKILSGWNVK
ncbi:MAG: DUF6305 family protein [Pyramidobacter sp.]|nr:DUF6305 family protein [Pyramidobacter sp.]